MLTIVCLIGPYAAARFILYAGRGPRLFVLSARRGSGWLTWSGRLGWFVWFRAPGVRGGLLEDGEQFRRLLSD